MLCVFDKALILVSLFVELATGKHIVRLHVGDRLAQSYCLLIGIGIIDQDIMTILGNVLFY